MGEIRPKKWEGRELTKDQLEDNQGDHRQGHADQERRSPAPGHRGRRRAGRCCSAKRCDCGRSKRRQEGAFLPRRQPGQGRGERSFASACWRSSLGAGAAVCRPCVTPVPSLFFARFNSSKLCGVRDMTRGMVPVACRVRAGRGGCGDADRCDCQGGEREGVRLNWIIGCHIKTRIQFSSSQRRLWQRRQHTQPDHSPLWRPQHGQLSQSRGGVVERWFVTMGCTVGVPDVASTQNSRM